jgi:polyisoprenyl-teichoic acid--peptidoglycan teichoic acid transferase
VVLRAVLLVALVALAVPGASVHPTTLSLSRGDNAKSVDFEDGVVWLLVLGSDAEGDEALKDGRTDVIELIGINSDTGSAAGIGIPRDAWVKLPDGPARINEALSKGGTGLTARAVEGLVGIAPDYVLVTGFEGFLAMAEAVGEVEVRVPRAFETDEGLAVEQGLNRFDADQALDFARSRGDLPGADFDRMANQQALLLGYLRALRAREGQAGFMEDVTLAGLGGLDTDLAPTDLYRLAQAVTQVDPSEATGCLVRGTPFTTEGNADVIRPDKALAQRLGRDAEGDATLDPACQG